MAPTAGRLHRMSAPYFATDHGVLSAHAASSPLKMANAPAPDVDTRIKSSTVFRFGWAGGMLITIAAPMPGKRPLNQEKSSGLILGGAVNGRASSSVGMVSAPTTNGAAASMTPQKVTEWVLTGSGGPSSGRRDKVAAIASAKAQKPSAPAAVNLRSSAMSLLCVSAAGSASRRPWKGAAFDPWAIL